jgi:hypothetical protein
MENRRPERSETQRSWPSTPRVDIDELEQLIRSVRALAIHCWATWDHYEREMDRSWVEILPRWAHKLFVCCFEVDPPEHHRWLHQWNVNNVPASPLSRREACRNPMLLNEPGRPPYIADRSLRRTGQMILPRSAPKQFAPFAPRRCFIGSIYRGADGVSTLSGHRGNGRHYRRNNRWFWPRVRNLPKTPRLLYSAL